MTMINVVSAKDRIVVSADSCVTNGDADNRDKIFYIPYSNIAIMLYEHGDRYEYIHKFCTLDKVLNKTEDIPAEYKEKSPIALAKKLVEISDEKTFGIMSVANSGSMDTGVVVVGYEEGIPTLCTFVVEGKKKRKPSDYRNLTGTYESYLSKRDIEPEKEFATVKGAKQDTTIHIFKGNFSMVFATTEGDTIESGYKKAEELAQMIQEEAVKYSRDMIEKTIDECEKELEEGEKCHIGGPIDTLVFSKDGDVDTTWEKKLKKQKNQ